MLSVKRRTVKATPSAEGGHQMVESNRNTKLVDLVSVASSLTGVELHDCNVRIYHMRCIALWDGYERVMPPLDSR